MCKAYRKIKPLSNCVLLFGIILIAACIKHPKPSIDFSNDDFIVATPNSDADITYLASEYLHDPSKRGLILKFNGLDAVIPGQKVIVPLKPFQWGGLADNGFQTVPILSYHRFSKKRSGKMIVTEANFEAQMKFLSRNGYHVITMNQLFDFLEFKSQIPDKSVVITIDDGWLSFKDIALPILKKYNFPATLFIYNDFIGSKKAMSWEQLKMLASSMIDIQCHTQSHRNLGIIKKNESLTDYLKSLEQEIVLAKTVIKKKLGKNCRYFAYPYGATNQFVIKMLKEHGYRGALGVARKGNPFFINPYNIHRSMIYGNYDIEKFKKNLMVFKKMELK